jgi:Domain of unknown function (DUF3127)
MNLEITGKLIVKYDTQVVSDRFKKREFVIELQDEVNGNTYVNYAKLQLVQNKTDLIDRYNIGDNVKISFNIKGNKWVKDGRENYITSLEAWRVENANAVPGSNAGAQQTAGNNYSQGNSAGFTPAHNYNPSPETKDDLPF